MLLQTLNSNWQKARVTNCADAALPARIPQAAKPAGTGNNAAQATASAVVFDTTPVDKPVGGGGSNNAIVVQPYGTGADNTTMLFAVIGWSFLPGLGVADKDLWVPMLLGSFGATLSSTLPGLAGRTIGTGELFADTITLTGTSGNAGVDNDIISPANNTPASVTLDTKGCQIVEVLVATNSSATDVNALVRVI